LSHADIDPLMQLDNLLACLDEGRVPAAETCLWLADGVRRMIDGTALDTALGLVRKGAPPVRHRLAQIRADMLLASAVRVVPVPYPSPSVWDRCQRLAPLLSRYVRGAWRSDRRLADAPGGDVWRVYAWHSLQLCPDPPLTPNGLWALVKRDKERRLQPQPHTLLAHLMSHPCHNPPNASPSSAPSGRR